MIFFLLKSYSFLAGYFARSFLSSSGVRGLFLQAKKIKSRPPLPPRTQPPTESDSELIKERWKEYLKKKKEQDDRAKRLALIGIGVILIATASPHFIPLLEFFCRGIFGGGS